MIKYLVASWVSSYCHSFYKLFIKLQLFSILHLLLLSLLLFLILHKVPILAVGAEEVAHGHNEEKIEDKNVYHQPVEDMRGPVAAQRSFVHRSSCSTFGLARIN